MENETMKQQLCEACDEVITLSKPSPEIRYCPSWTEDINAWHEEQGITPEELDAWADIWETQKLLTMHRLRIKKNR